jgi:alpha-beta hydrolase superfamily lysophospholipase
VPGTLALALVFLHTPPWEAEPWKTIAEENAPGGAPIPAPILIVQGAADTIVDSKVTKELVHKLCQNGEQADLRLYPGVGHIATGHDAAPAVVSWIADRFADNPAPTTCPG